VISNSHKVKISDIKYFKIHFRHHITKYTGLISVACRVIARADGLNSLDYFPNHRRSPQTS
jgi:hypothetical protein